MLSSRHPCTGPRVCMFPWDSGRNTLPVTAVLLLICWQGHSSSNLSNLPLAESGSLSKCTEVPFESHLCRRHDGLESGLWTTILWEEHFILLSRCILASPIAMEAKSTMYSPHHLQGLRRSLFLSDIVRLAGPAKYANRLFNKIIKLDPKEKKKKIKPNMVATAETVLSPCYSSSTFQIA